MFTVKKWELNYEYIRCLKRYPGNINGFEELLRIYVLPKVQRKSKSNELTKAAVF